MSFTIEDDPILRVYNVKKTENLCYDVSGFFSPIAIRDQVVRTCAVIDRAIRHEIITPNRPLLVIGGGIAGITAAIKAVENNIKTIIVEKKTPLLNLSRSDRYFSPIQYDWVAEHWTKNEFPWKASKSIPTTLIEGLTRDMLASIKARYNDMKPNNKIMFKLHQYTELTDFHIVDKGDKHKFLVGKFMKNGKNFNPSIPDVGIMTEFGMGLSCTGFGRERVFVKNGHPYLGVEYWNLDSFDFVKLGKVLICGGGDGALQDFLLIATDKESAKSIYTGLDLTSSLLNEIEKAIFEVEERNAREAIWWSRKDNDTRTKNILCNINRESQKIHLEKAEYLLKNAAVKKRLDKIIRPEAFKNISLAFPCDHFTGCYPLNRFLALLIGRHIEIEQGRKVFHPYSIIENVVSADSRHICNQDSNNCLDYKHSISVAENPVCCCGTTTEKPMSPENPYDFVMLRFGIVEEGVSKVFKDVPSIPGLQITPYILP